MGSAICGVLDDITVNVPVGKLGRPPRQMEAVSSCRLTYQNVPRGLKSRLDRGLFRHGVCTYLGINLLMVQVKNFEE